MAHNIALDRFLVPSKPTYECPKHGGSDSALTIIVDFTVVGTWCLQCLAEKLDESGVSRMTLVHSDEKQHG